MNTIWPVKSGLFFRESHIIHPLNLHPLVSCALCSRPHPATPVPYRRSMPLRLLLAILCLARLSPCPSHGPAIPPAPVPSSAAETLDPSITPLTMEQDDQVAE